MSARAWSGARTRRDEESRILKSWVALYRATATVALLAAIIWRRRGLTAAVAFLDSVMEDR